MIKILIFLGFVLVQINSVIAEEKTCSITCQDGSDCSITSTKFVYCTCLARASREALCTINYAVTTDGNPPNVNGVEFVQRRVPVYMVSPK